MNDYFELSKKFAGNPNNWNTNVLCSYIKWKKLRGIRKSLKKMSINGHNFLLLESKDDLWDVLNLTRKDERILKECQKLLQEYDKSLRKEADNIDITEEKKYDNYYEEQSDNSEDFTNKILKKTIRKKSHLIVWPLISIKQIDQEKSKNYEFITSFEIFREDSDNSNKWNKITSKSESISEEHARVQFLDNYGFYLYDKGSENKTFINIPVKSSIVLVVGLEISMGCTTFKVLSIENDRIILETRLLDCKERNVIKIENITEEGVYFGKKKEANKKRFLYDEDMSIENENAIFLMKKGKILMTALLSSKGVWVCLGGTKQISDFFLLRKGMEFNIAREIDFEIEKIVNEICPPVCNCGEYFVNSVFLECFHAKICWNCADKLKKCPTCNVKKDFRRLINLYEKI